MRPQVIIIATIVLDVALFGFNLVVALMGGSKAVLSQAIYTLTDLIGSGLLFWGFWASLRPPSHDHPFGYGKERFFWAFTSSLVTFTIAGLLVLAEGVGQLTDPAPVSHVVEGLIVVGATLVLSLAGIAVTLRELRAGRETLSSFLESSQIGLKTIFYQDLVSVFGSFVAFFGILAVYWTHEYAVDGITAAGVGVLLITTGVVVAAESRELLVGKAIPPNIAREILAMVERDPSVRKVRSLQTMMLGPDDVLVALKINFQDGLTTDQIESAIDQVSHAMREVYPSFRHLVIEPES